MTVPMVELVFGYALSREATAALGSFVAKLNTSAAKNLYRVGQAIANFSRHKRARFSLSNN
jgi:hypothetical protein